MDSKEIMRTQASFYRTFIHEVSTMYLSWAHCYAKTTFLLLKFPSSYQNTNFEEFNSK